MTTQNVFVVVADLPGHGLTILASRCEGITKHKKYQKCIGFVSKYCDEGVACEHWSQRACNNALQNQRFLNTFQIHATLVQHGACKSCEIHCVL